MGTTRDRDRDVADSHAVTRSGGDLDNDLHVRHLRTVPERAKEHLGKVGKVFPCTYFTSHWVAFVAVAWFHPRVFDGWWFANYVVVAFAVIAIANVVARVLRRLNDQ